MRFDELPPFLRIEQAQALTQLGRSQLYEQTRRWRETGGKEGIPVVRFGRCLRIPTAALLRLARSSSEPTTAMAAEVCIEHRYPAAAAFVRHHGAEAVAVLHDLLVHARLAGDDLVVEASVRHVAERLRFLSKDTVHRRLRQLLRAGVLRRIDDDPLGAFARRIYLVDLSGTGITVLFPSDTVSGEQRRRR